MIELTSAYIGARDPKFALNPAHIIHVSPCNIEKHERYKDARCCVEYVGGSETQTAYVQETYEEVRKMLP